jgi:outer membrane protein OmpA-like peptidoglycan-associated protein
MKRIITFFIVVTMFGLPCRVNSQIKVDLNKKIINQTNRRANKNADQAIDKGLDGIENGIKGTGKKDDKKDQTDTSQKNDQTQGNQKTQGAGSTADSKTSGENQNSSGQEQQEMRAFSKYDFVPGDQVILFDDFSQDEVGDFPALWTANAAGEINTLNNAPGNWLNLNSTDGNYFILKSIDFPKNFIIEFDIIPKKIGGRIAAGLILYGEEKPKEMDNGPHPGNCGIIISIEKERWNTMGYKTGESSTITGSSEVNPVEPDKVNHVIIWAQNRRFRIYHKQAKVLDIPTNVYDGTKFNRLCFRLSRGASCGSYISNIRITSASPDMRSKLLTEGKLVTYGIYFDINKDIVKPESYGTLKEIAKVLTENPDVKVKIVGHTDSDGADPANLDLSKRRGASVKEELVKNFAIDASRLESDGLGEIQPVAPNDTPGNKALNRRVELIKI